MLRSCSANVLTLYIPYLFSLIYNCKITRRLQQRRKFNPTISDFLTSRIFSCRYLFLIYSKLYLLLLNINNLQIKILQIYDM